VVRSQGSGVSGQETGDMNGRIANLAWGIGLAEYVAQQGGCRGGGEVGIGNACRGIPGVLIKQPVSIGPLTG